MDNNPRSINADDSNIGSSNSEFVDLEKKIPKILVQRYELKEEIGRGAHGRIHTGKDKLTK